MRARWLLLIAAAALAGAILGAAPGSVGHVAAAPVRPNVLVIETDDQTAASLRFMPNVESLIVKGGTLFENSFVNLSRCCPSRATFLTGQYAHNHGVMGNTGPTGGFDRFEALHANNNLATWLQGAGYRTALIGKYLNGYPGTIVPPGWSDWYGAAPPGQHVYDYTLNENGAPFYYGSDPAYFKQDVLTGKALDFIRLAPRPRPFFLWLTYTAPHNGGPDPSPNPPFNCRGTAKPAPRDAHAFDRAPLPRPPNFNEANVSDKPAAIRKLPRLGPNEIADVRRQYRCRLESLLSVDEGVKRIVEALKAQGELGRTLLVFTSDNGFFAGEHRIPSGKKRVYEESIRVPLAIRGPAIPRGEVVRDLVINADLAPTVLDAANVKPGLLMDGRSLIPVAKHPGIERNRELLIEEPGFAAIRTERYLYAEYVTGERELYDLERDPFELQNRHNDPLYARVELALARRLHALKTCAGPSCRVQQTDPSPP